MSLKKLFFRPDVEIKGEHAYCNGVHDIVYKSHNPRGFKNTNVAVAAFVTAYGRLRLYEAMEAVGFENVMYCDTDSIIFRGTPENKAVTGNRLGDLEDELKEKAHITDFCTIGAKVYHYRTNIGEVKGKLKGITLHSENTAKWTWNYVNELIDAYVYEGRILEKALVASNDFKVNKFGRYIKSEGDTSKKVQFTADKRTVNRNSAPNWITTTPISLSRNG